MANFTKTYKENGKSIYSCQYVISFCTKYKRKIFEEKDIEVLKTSFNSTAKKYGFKIHQMKLSPNVVVLTVELNDQSFGIEEAVIKLKKDSKDLLIKNDSSFKSRIPSIWTRETFISTIGTVQEKELNHFFDIQENYVESISKNK